MRKYPNTIEANIADAVDRGLSSTPKSLPSWLFYDAQGDLIFQSIMRMPEYYPTACEYEILKKYKHQILNNFSHRDDHFQLIELGAGDGIKTELLLKHLIHNKAKFSYLPVDVSWDVLAHLKNRLSHSLPDLEVIPCCERYEDSLSALKQNDQPKMILFLGANIGNYTIGEGVKFLLTLSKEMTQKDSLLIGFDLKKDPRVILSAYDDAAGITRDFNLNLLNRMNNELGATFSIEQFSHYPFYDPASGAAKSFLISNMRQEVYIDALGKSFQFESYEAIQTEVSQKYDLPLIEEIASKAALEIVDVYYDAKKYFCDVVFRRV